MPRTTWTDERLDDLSRRVETGFAHVDARFNAVDARFNSLETRFDARFDAMDARFDALQQTMMRLGTAMIVCLLGAIVAFALGG